MLKQVLDILDLVDRGSINGKQIIELFKNFPFTEATTQTVQGEQGSTDFVKIIIFGKNGKQKGGKSPSLGIIGRLGGIGARPEHIGMVSDADGAVAALSVALKLSIMSIYNDRLDGDVIITTHICPNAPSEPHFPVDFMGSPVNMEQMNKYEVVSEADAILSIDTTKGNDILSHCGYAISPTVKEGYILKVSQDLLQLMKICSGKKAATFPISIQDITPYSNNLFHINSILQPSTATDAPVVGVAVTTESVVPGCATGASHEIDICEASRFIVEVAKKFTAGKIEFFDFDEFIYLRNLYGTMKIFQTDPSK